MKANRQNSYRLNVVHLAATACVLAFVGGLSAAQSAVSLTASPNPVVYGAPLTLTATVSPPSATGKVTFFDGSIVLGTAAVASGSATLRTVTISAGPRLLKAHYSGDASLTASNSATISETVNAVAGGGFLPIRPFLSDVSDLFSLIVVADFNGDGEQDVA